MTDLKTLVEQEMEHAGTPAYGIGDVRARRDHMRRNQRIGAGLIAIAIAVAVAWLGADVIRAEHTVPANPPVPSPLPTPTVAESGWSPVVERGSSVVDGHGHSWSDPARDTSKPWVDIEKVEFLTGVNEGSWSISLRADPPRAVRPGYRWIISYGLVLDTTGDGVADFLVGLNNDTPKNGDFHAWVTDLATGETDDQVGGPYGFPIEFAHPSEPGVEGVHLTFLTGTAPMGMDPETVRFYAWASETMGETVIANDYAPDTGWATLTSVPSPPPSHTPTVAQSTWSPVVERDYSVVYGRHGVPHLATSGGTTWLDPHDTSVPWIDIEKLTFNFSGGGQWIMELPAAPPRGYTSGPGRVTSFGLVLDTNGDGVADYLAGLNSDAPKNGALHTWVTDLATGETDEQFGGPYGFPVEFSSGGRGGNSYVLLTFLAPSYPAGLDEHTVRFYAWASETQGERVIASDYAPDTGWMMSPG